MVEGSLEQADFQTKRDVIGTLVKHIEIGEQEVKLVYRVDGLPFAQAPERGFLQDRLRRDHTALWNPFNSRMDFPIDLNT